MPTDDELEAEKLRIIKLPMGRCLFEEGSGVPDKDGWVPQNSATYCTVPDAPIEIKDWRNATTAVFSKLCIVYEEQSRQTHRFPGGDGPVTSISYQIAARMTGTVIVNQWQYITYLDVRNTFRFEGILFSKNNPQSTIFTIDLGSIYRACEQNQPFTLNAQAAQSGPSLLAEAASEGRLNIYHYDPAERCY